MAKCVIRLIFKKFFQLHVTNNKCFECIKNRLYIERGRALGAVKLHYITLLSGIDIAITKVLHAIVDKIGILNQLLAVNADSLSVDTGLRKRLIQQLECQIARPLQ